MAFFKPGILNAINRAKSELCNAETAMENKDEKAAFWHINKAQEQLKQSAASLMGNVEAAQGIELGETKSILQRFIDKSNNLLLRAEKHMENLEAEMEQKEKQGDTMAFLNERNIAIGNALQRAQFEIVNAIEAKAMGNQKRLWHIYKAQKALKEAAARLVDNVGMQDLESSCKCLLS